MKRRLRILVLCTLSALATGCAIAPRTPLGVMEMAERPAEKALLSGIRQYEDAQYERAEAQLVGALQTGLASPRDRAAAYKHLAFIYCASQRIALCQTAFRSARQADPAFALSRSESGHPVWGPVYRQLLP